MSKLNLSVFLNAYDDNRPSNAPSRNPIKWARDLIGLSVSNPKSEDYTIAPGQTQVLFSGMRTLAQDGTTEYSLALAPNQTSIYQLSWAAGTMPNFRTPRTTGADATTQITSSINGPIETFTSSLGVPAFFTGMIAGMTTPVTITAVNVGTPGNSVVLVADGTSSINALIAAWNTANPSNTIALTTGDGTQIPTGGGTFAMFTGTIPGMINPVTITANIKGTAGNSVVLTGNGTSNINALITAWNTANPSNQVTLSSGNGTQVPDVAGPGSLFAGFTGLVAGMTTPVTIGADHAGTIGNAVVLAGDGTSSINTLIANWNAANPSNDITLTSGDGTQVLAFADSSGTYASFTGNAPTTSVTITANVKGVAGNSVVLTGNGTLSLSTLIANWNTSNPSNQITLTSGDGTQILGNSTFASFTGIFSGTSTSISITANHSGTVGNSVSLIGDGISSIDTLVENWNINNPSNAITLASGDGSQVPGLYSTTSLSGGTNAQAIDLSGGTNKNGTIYLTGGTNLPNPIDLSGGTPTGTYASYSGTPVGTTLPITLTAETIGTPGNSISLIGNGTSTIAGLIAAWNTSNPSNMVAQTAGINTQIPSVGAVIDLSGGAIPNSINLSGGAAATPLNLIVGGAVVGDYVTLGSEFNASNQGTFQIVALTANSFSIVNPLPIIEGPITLGASFASQIQINSAAGVQVGDILVISSGFSPVSWGSYVITSVLAESLQFSSTAILPTESAILTEVVIYSMAKSLVYMESDASIVVNINGVNLAAPLQPYVITNCSTGLTTAQMGYPTPGMLLLTSTIYSLSVTNNGIVPANVFLAAAE